MTYLTHACAFILGLSFALLLIASVSMRPKAKRLLRQAGLVKEHKARVPRVSKFLDPEEDEEIRFV